MDLLVQLARRQWELEPTVENAARYIRVLEQGFDGLLRGNRTKTHIRNKERRFMENVLTDGLNAVLEQRRFGRVLERDDEQLLGVHFTKRPRKPRRRSRSSRPKHPRTGINYDRVDIRYDPLLDGEDLKFSEIIELSRTIIDYMGGKVIDIGITNAGDVSRWYSELTTNERNIVLDLQQDGEIPEPYWASPYIRSQPVVQIYISPVS